MNDDPTLHEAIRAAKEMHKLERNICITGPKYGLKIPVEFISALKVRKEGALGCIVSHLQKDTDVLKYFVYNVMQGQPF